MMKCYTNLIYANKDQIYNSQDKCTIFLAKMAIYC